MRRLAQFGVPAIHVLWVLVALAVLPNGGHFLLDEAVFFHQAISASKGLWFPTLGPMISGTQPLAFTPGGAFALLLAPFFWLSNDPRAGVIGIIVLSAIGGLLWDQVLQSLGEKRLRVRLGVATLIAFLPWHARLSDRIWNVQLFTFLTPLFFYAAVRLVQSRSQREALGFAALTGFVFALSTQIHLGALGLSVAALGLLGDRDDRAAWLRRLPRIALGVLLGMGIAYAPYVVRELSHDWQNTRQIFEGPKTAQGLSDVVQALLAPARFCGILRFDWDSEQLQFGKAEFFDGLLLALGAVLFIPALGSRSILRAPTLLSLAWLPLFFSASGRTFYPHYVASLAPLWIFAGAQASLGTLAGLRNSTTQRLLAGILGFVLTAGSVRWIEHYGKRAFGIEKIPTIPLLLEQSRAQAAFFAQRSPKIYGVSNETEGLRLPFRERDPATSILQATLLQWVDGRAPIFVREGEAPALCRIHLALPGHSALDSVQFEPGTTVTSLYYESVLACRPL